VSAAESRFICYTIIIITISVIGVQQLKLLLYKSLYTSIVDRFAAAVEFFTVPVLLGIASPSFYQYTATRSKMIKIDFFFQTTTRAPTRRDVQNRQFKQNMIRL